MAFVRSRVAHARIAAILTPPGAAGSVFVADDLTGVKPIRAISKLPGYKVSDYPILAQGKVRFVGELVAMCIADTRAEAEDLARNVSFEYEDLGAVANMFEAQKPGVPLLHEHWGNNVVLVNTRSKVHQRNRAKIHQLESRWLGGLVSERGSARGIGPLAAAERSNFALVAEAVSAGCSGLIVTDAALAVFESEAGAVHLEDMNVMGKAIEQRAGQALGGEHAGPFVEGQIAGNDDGAPFVALTEDLEEQLGAGRR